MKYVVICAALLATPVMAETKAESCGYQGDVVAALQAQRLKRVKERKATEAVLAQDNGWPEKYDNAVPLIAPWVYELKRKFLKQDLRAVWIEMCLPQ